MNADATMDQPNVALPQTALTELIDLLGEDAIDLSIEARLLAAQDVFTDDPSRAPLAVLRPRHARDVARTLAVLSAHRIPVAPRGGGMSYTEGFLSHRPYVAMDLRRLTRIRAVSVEDRLLIAEAGCTWGQIAEHVSPLGLAPAMKPPISGSVSTLGGAASQNLPCGMENFLGLEVALMDGTQVQTGALSTGAEPLPLRGFGPDVSGLFLGDCGAFGVKTAVALRLRRKPSASAFLSFAFPTMATLAEAMTSLQQIDSPLGIMGLDRLEKQGSAALGWREKITTSQQMLAAQRYSPAAIARLLRGRTAERALAQSMFSLHVTIDADGSAQARDLRSRVSAVALQACGVPIPSTLPEALAAKPFSIRGMLGKDGERWAPVHGIFRPSVTQTAVDLVESFFAEHRETLERHRISHSFLFSAGPAYFLVEPMFYWRDEIPALHRSVLPPRTVAKAAGLPPDFETRLIVRDLRIALSKRFDDLGAAKCQLGRLYSYGGRLSPETMLMIKALKRTLDPHHLMNPGVLGL